MKKLRLTDETKELVTYFEWRGYLHEVSESVTTAYSFPKFGAFLKQLSKRYTIPYDQLLWYRPQEIIKSIQSGEKLSGLDIQARKHYCLLLFKDRSESLYVGARAERVEKKELGAVIEEVSNKKLTSFQGVVAQSGHAKGVTCLLKKAEEMKSFKTGGILVTPMTRPQWMPAIRRAAAIVTDEGGVLCHAAIVSRELKKPCIIGTKIATKVLKDGDLVEVDADKGVVKILKRAGNQAA